MGYFNIKSAKKMNHKTYINDIPVFFFYTIWFTEKEIFPNNTAQ